MTKEEEMTEFHKAFVAMNPDGRYRAVCGSCEWAVYDIETVETAGHLLDLHRGDEHFDE